MQTSRLFISFLCTKTVHHIFSWCGILDCPVPFFSITEIYEDSKRPRWWFQLFFIFIPKIGEMIQFDFRIFFRWMVQPPTRVSRDPSPPSQHDLEHHQDLGSFSQCQSRWYQARLSQAILEVSPSGLDGNLCTHGCIEWKSENDDLKKAYIMFFKGWCSASPS